MDEESDLPSIIAYLIRSGQVRISSSDEALSEEDSGSEGEQPGTRDPTTGELTTDLSSLKSNFVLQDVKVKSGRFHPRTDERYNTKSLTELIQKREIGLSRHQKFTQGDLCVINSKFLPNRVRTVATYSQKAFCGTYSQDGNIFLSASQDQNIRVYKTDRSFKLLKTIRARDVGWSVLDTAFSPDGNYIIYSSWSDCIHLCNIYGDHEVHEALNLTPGEHSFCIFSLTFSSDNSEILCGANDGCLYVYDRESNQRTLRIESHDDDVNAVSFADDSSQILFSGADDGLCKVWDRRTLREDHPIAVGTFAGHTDGITYIDSKRDARYLLSNSKDQTIKLWDVRAFANEDTIRATKRAVSAQKWDYRWQQVPRRARKKRLLGDTSVMTYKGHCVLHTLIRCHFSPAFSTGQRYVYTGCATGSVIIYDLLTGAIVKKLDNHAACVRDVSWHPYYNKLVSTSWDGSLGLWEHRSSAAEEADSESEIPCQCDEDEESDIPERTRPSVLRGRRFGAMAKKVVVENSDLFKGLYD
ncbi:hypothetical protein SNE40_017832 [Patella caerulea]